MNEIEFIDQLKKLATHPAARGLVDDAALLAFGRSKLVMTHDMMVDGVHFAPDTDPADVAWKLVAVNLSDLAAKGAKPLGILLGYCLSHDDEWDSRFLNGLQDAIDHFTVPLLGGDTVSIGENSQRSFGLTAIGEAKGHLVPSRHAAEAGHSVFVTGNIGDAWAGLQIATGKLDIPENEISATLLKAHNRPIPRLDDGRALASLVSTMMDISDGLMLDASRIAAASDINLEIDLGRVPLSPEFVAIFGDNEESRLRAATGGDDYQLLFTVSPETVLPISAVRIGICKEGAGVSVVHQGETAPLPDHLGFVHA